MAVKWAIDVSHYDAFMGLNSYKAVDWVKARDQGGLGLAIMKSTEGTMFKDPAFSIQWKAAAGVLPRMAYHFFRCNQNAIQQAQFCWSVVNALGFDPDKDFFILDFETMDGKTGAECLKAAGSWLYEIEKHGVTPLLYTYPSFWKAIGGESAAWAAKFPLGIAQWPKDRWILGYSPTIFTTSRLETFKADIAKQVLKPVPLKPWTKPALWQFTARADSNAIPGHPAVKKVVDYNAIYMELGETPEGTTPTPTPTPPESGEGLYRFVGSSLKVFSGPASTFRQVSNLVNLQGVNVLEVVLNEGEKWARIESPAGWCRYFYLEYVGPDSTTSPTPTPEPTPNPSPNPTPEPTPVTPSLGLYRFPGVSLKVFAGPASTNRQVSTLINYQSVSVLELTMNEGEQWARLESPAGWCRYSYLQYIGPGPIPTPTPTPEPTPTPAPVPSLGTYRFTGISLKVFEGPASIFRQVSTLINNQTVTVLETASNAGEQWARLEAPAGWCRFSYLTRI